MTNQLYTYGKYPRRNAYFESQCRQVAGHVAFEAELALQVDVGVSGREMGHGHALRWELLEQSAGHSIEAAGLDGMSLQSNVVRVLVKQMRIKKNGYNVTEWLWTPGLFHTTLYNLHFVTFIQQGCIKLVKRNSIYDVTKDFVPTLY